jgi:membrane-bound metal-dependent hydrolase YbcI (DUF457 family)
VYVGHAAIAASLKGKRPRIPIGLLVPVAFAPDWIDSFSHVVHRANANLSHSLLSVAIGATACGLLYWLWSRNAGDALVVWLAYASHWPADFITGVKPTWPTGPMLGLELYSHPGWDLLVESALVVTCWLVYRRSLPVESRRRSIGLLIPLGLIGMQVVFEALQRPSYP